MTINLHRLDWNNLGDQACSPCHYFKELRNVRHVDMDVEWPEADTYILGGGGVLHGKWPEKIKRLVDGGKRVIAWGIGLNNHDAAEFIYPQFIDRFLAIGIRDYGNPWHYVPCPSCLHPAFDRMANTKPRRPYAIYEHRLFPIPIYDKIPRLQNRQPFEFFEEAIRFLAHAETIVTNTFHGAYWAMLLGRKVVIFRPYSTRFHGFKVNPPCADLDDWDMQAELAPLPPAGYLEECRRLNMEFFGAVKHLLV